ncbi:MAG: hypothetical protein QOD06_2574 [Candidatus Binatota bacterium]|nr:hypothetical protein [Candidatus Binatota bacterium]
MLLEFGSLVGLALAVSAGLLPDERMGRGLRLSQVIAPAFCCGVSYYYNDLYDPRMVHRFRDFCTRLLPTLAILSCVLMVFYGTFPRLAFEGHPALSTLGILVSLVVSSVPLRWALSVVVDEFSPPERVILVGRNALTGKLLEALETALRPHYRIVGIAQDPHDPLGPSDQGGTDVEPARRVPLSRLDRLVRDVRPDRILVTLPEHRERGVVRKLFRYQSQGIIVENGAETYERLTGKLAFEAAPPSALFFSKEFQKPALERAITRALSAVVAALVLVLTAPVFLLIALAIEIDDGGPVFFVQERVGLHRKPFRLLKFRTMRPVDRRVSEWERDNTDRITRVGRWLRRHRLDELPNFVNILCGDMNLVGPRPHPMSNYELFAGHIPYYSLRAMVRPGITGWAQVRFGYANDLAEEIEKMRYDLYYIKHKSLGLDLQIVVETVRTVFVGSESPEELRADLAVADLAPRAS